ncbi:MAG: flagellar basal body P-ring protein FlgI [Planctomycetaceae bacterium]|nr:flagellar basal body P-ring protein FlgI [Planctomycetaceae bacterium]
MSDKMCTLLCKFHALHAVLCILILLFVQDVRAELTIGTVAHVKGQETNTLHGIGLVVGLRGTGDKTKSFQETARSMTRILELCGHSTATLKDTIMSKNAALVSVTVTVPGQGAREGDLLDCQVASIGSASSLEGGQLLLTSLIGPVPASSPQNTIVYGQATGRIVLEKKETPTIGRISQGCRLLDDFFNPYVQDGIITLVIDQRFATFEMAEAVAMAVDQESPDGKRYARAINQNNVLVKLPANSVNEPVGFISDIMSREIYGVKRVPTVIINKDAGSVAIDEDVEIMPTTVTHGNMVITISAVANQTQQPQQPQQPQQQQKPERFVGIDPNARLMNIENPKLKALQESLNAVNVPARDIITIIEMLDRQGSLHGRIIYH